MKGKKEPVKGGTKEKKIGRPIKEVVPLTSKPPREICPIRPPELISREFPKVNEPNEIFPEWPSDEEVSNYDFGINNNTVFRDNYQFNLPQSIIIEGYNEIKWLRPEQYIKEHYLDERLKKAYPNKNIIKMRNLIKHYFLNKQKTTHSTASFTVHLLDELFIEKEDDILEEAKMHIFKPYFQFLSTKLDLKIIESFEREETEEENKKRREEQEALEKARQEQMKKDKKKVVPPTKKPEENESNKVYEAKPSSISMADKYPKFSKWIASLFQVIKDMVITDCNTNQHFYQKIYPQKNGIPIYNPSGKYWVKLYHMGKYRKIEIDDTMPCGKYDEILLPRCNNLEEIWPQILTKAILKLYSYKYKTSEGHLWEDVGDISIISGLTGYIGEKLTLKNENNFEVFEHILCDENFKNKQKFLIGYHPKIEKIVIKEPINTVFTTKRNTGNSNSPPNDNIKSKLAKRNTLMSHQHLPFLMINSNKPTKEVKEHVHFEERKENKIDIEAKIMESKQKKNLLRDNSFVNRKSDSKLIQIDYKPENKTNEKFQNIFTSIYSIIKDYAYSIVETFQNVNFNMIRTKLLDFSDLKMKIQQAKVNYKELSREEKKNYIQGIMELKAKQKEEKLKRIEDLKLKGKKINLVKIKNECSNSQSLTFILEYSNEEIEMAKKCLLNKWEFPPPSFFEHYFQQKHTNFPDLYDDYLKSPNKSPTVNSGWNKETYLQLIGNEQFSNEQEPLQKYAGAWVDYEEFLSLFKKFIVLHNPRYYRTQLKLDDNWYNYVNDVYEPNTDFQVFNILPITNSSTDYLSYNNKLYKVSSCILILFEPNIDKNLQLVDIPFYIIMDILDNQGKTIIENISLTSFYHAYQIDTLSPTKEYFLVIKSVISPVGYHLSLFSDHGIETLSYNNYLKRVRNYYSYCLKIEHSSIEKNKYFLLMRAVFKVSQRCKLNYQLKYNDKFIKQCIELILIKKDKNIKLFPLEYIDLEPSDSNYYIIMQVTPPFNCPDGVIELELFSDDSSLNFDVIQHCETYEVFDKYVPNKHGVIFRELVYAADLVYTSLYIKFRKENVIRIQNPVVDPKKKDSTNNLITVIESIEIDEKVRIILELYKNNNLIFSQDNYNNFLIQNLILEGVPVVQSDPKSKNPINNVNTPVNIPYILVCRLDLTEAPQWLLKPENCEDVGWVIRVTSSDTLGFLKDTTKEDSEKALKDGWELAEMGRSEKAKKARSRYILSMKKEKGETLTPEEEAFLNIPRERKNAQSQIIVQPEETNKKIDPKKKTDPKKKEVKEVVQTVVQPVYVLDLNKPLPKPETHTSRYIKDFLNYCYKERVLSNNNGKDTNNKLIMSQEIQEQISEKILKEVVDYDNEKAKESEEFMVLKNSQQDALKLILNETLQRRKEMNKEKEDLINERDALKINQIQKNETEKKLLDIIAETYDINIMISTYKEIYQSNFKSDLVEKAFKVINTKKEEQYRNDLKKMTPKDKQTSLKIIEEIKNLGLKISEDITKKLNELAGI